MSQDISEIAGELQRHGVEEARLKAELLVAHILGVSRLKLHVQPDRMLTESHREQLAMLVRRLAGREPIQYVLGETEFMGHVMKTDARALIPRPETELLVERVLACDALWARERPAITDVGTGSGCIVIALALARPQAVYTATDTSKDALNLARENARRLGVLERIRFVRADMLDGATAASQDAVVSNPPYVASGALRGLAPEVRDHEPRTALDGGPDGLAAIRKLAAGAFQALGSGGRLYMEIGADQHDAVRDILRSAGFAGVRVAQDLAGLPRFAEGIRP